MRDIFTIDPTDAKDFDDAISLDEVDGMLRLGVHIADVSSYVAWDSHIDICARDRATSVYLVDRVLPMLPEKLSNDVCSLRPGEDRLTMTCDMYLDASANVRRYEIYPSVICSKRRFDYDEVQEILDGKRDDPYATKLARFDALAKRLLSLRLARGAIDFETVEAKPVLDERGMVMRVDLRHKTDATSMIEEAMILANETVARHAHANDVPFVYRVHEPPSAAALEALLPPLRELGYNVAELATGNPAAFQDVLDEAHGTREEPLVNYLVLRSMERAAYNTEPIGHFGLASTFYCHFTSPIRRYPDLVVHRMLKAQLTRRPERFDQEVAALPWIAEHSSNMERVAEKAARESQELKIVEYMERSVGQAFPAVVSGVTSYGVYVRLENTAEGFLPVRALGREYFAFDPVLHRLTGEDTGTVYRLGQRLPVILAAADPRAGRLDFRPAREGGR